MKQDQKKYIITFQESHVPNEEVQEILGLSKRNYKEGSSFLSSEKEPQDEDVLNFQELGIASLTLSDSEVTKLKKNKQIMAVEEDEEVHILEIADAEIEETDLNGLNDYELIDNFSEFHDNNNFDQLDLLDDSDNFEDYQDFDMENTDSESNVGYQRGAEETMKFIIKSIMSSESASNNATEDANGLRLPPFRLPFPRIPFRRLPIFRPQPTPWNINLSRAPQAWRRGITGRGVKVAVLDTGISRHPDLTIRGGVSFIPGVTSYNDGHSHGTHCAGIIAAKNNFYGVVGVAPGASLYAVKVLSDAGSGSMSGIIAGLNWCISNRMHIASMSLGGKSGPRVAYAQAIRRAQTSGVTVVVASGNSFGRSFPWVCSPANSIIQGSPTASPISVGAIDRNCRIAPFSSRGGRNRIWNQVDVVAPGVRINSTVLRNGYSPKSGTSMACPHVAGAAALVKQRYGNISPLQIKSRLQRTARDLGRRGYDTTFGSGLINCDRATR